MVALQPSVFLRGLGFFLVTNEWIFEANFSFFSSYRAGSSLAHAGQHSTLQRSPGSGLFPLHLVVSSSFLPFLLLGSIVVFIAFIFWSFANRILTQARNYWSTTVSLELTFSPLNSKMKVQCCSG